MDDEFDDEPFEGADVSAEDKEETSEGGDYDFEEYSEEDED